MELANQIFYLTIALITFGLIFPAYANLNSSDGSNNDTHYWFYAVVAQFVSASALTAFPLIGAAGLVIGTTSQYAVDVFLVMFFMSLWKTVPKNTAIALLLSIATIPFLQLLGYVYCTVAQVAIMIFLSLWQLYELNAVRKRDASIYIVFLMLVIALQITIAGLRIDHVLQYLDPSEVITTPHNRFDEPEHELVIRLGIVALYVLIIISIGNYHFDKLWHISQAVATERAHQIIDTMNALATARDNETGKHTLRTQHYARILADSLKREGLFSDVLTDKYIETLFEAAPLHDIGKVGIPDHILLKNGRLTPEETAVMQTHSTLGVGILSAAKTEHENAVIDLAISIAGTHHERWDGSGYPNGLSGKEIPLAGRIMAVADVYDALTTRRNYKDSWSHNDATKEIIKHKGVLFDPEVVEAFERAQQQFVQISGTLRDKF